jgi:hypothetical protein
MAITGQTLVNPASGERITFRTTAAATNGELVAIDLELPLGAAYRAACTSIPCRRSASRWCEG